MDRGRGQPGVFDPRVWRVRVGVEAFKTLPFLIDDIYIS